MAIPALWFDPFGLNLFQLEMGVAEFDDFLVKLNRRTIFPFNPTENEQFLLETGGRMTRSLEFIRRLKF